MGRPTGSKVERGPVGRRVAANVRRLREDQRWSLEALAVAMRKAGRPMPPTAISKVEIGDRRVDVDELVAFADALNVSTDELLYAGEPNGLTTFDYLQAMSAFVNAGFGQDPRSLFAVDTRDWDRLWELAQQHGLDPNRPGFWRQVAAAATSGGQLRTPQDLRELWEREAEEAGRG